MHFPPHNNLGFAAPSSGGAVVATPTGTRTVTATSSPALMFSSRSGWAKRPVRRAPRLVIQTPIKQRPVGYPPAGQLFDRGAVPIPPRVGPEIREIFDSLPGDQFRYSADQIREMLFRGKSETTERSGESDSGLPNALELEQRAKENDATDQFKKDSAAGAFGPTNGAAVNGSTEKPGNALLLAGLLFLLFGA